MTVTLLMDASCLVQYATSVDVRSIALGELVSAAGEDPEAVVGVPATCLAVALDSAQVAPDQMRELVSLFVNPHVRLLGGPLAVTFIQAVVALGVSAQVADLLLCAAEHEDAMVLTFDPVVVGAFEPSARGRVLDLGRDW